MNGLAVAGPPQSADQRVARKRQLMDELVALRTQKAEVLKQIQQIAKRQKTGGLPTKASELLAGNNKLVLQMEQRNRAEKVRGRRVCAGAARNACMACQLGPQAGSAVGASATVMCAILEAPPLAQDALAGCSAVQRQEAVVQQTGSRMQQRRGGRPCSSAAATVAFCMGTAAAAGRWMRLPCLHALLQPACLHPTTCLHHTHRPRCRFGWTAARSSRTC